MAEERRQAVVDVLNTINRAHLEGLATTDQWKDLVIGYFLCAKEEEAPEEEQIREKDQTEEVEKQPDPVEDEDEPLVITDLVEKILLEEWDEGLKSRRWR